MKKNKSRLISRFSWAPQGRQQLKGWPFASGLECAGQRAVVINKAPSICAQPSMRSQLLGSHNEGLFFWVAHSFWLSGLSSGV